MTSRNCVVEKIVLSGALCLGLTACNGSNSPGQNRLGYNGVVGSPVGSPQIAPNGTFNVGNVPCNINDLNPNSATNPNNPNSPCWSVRNQIANNQIPQQQLINGQQPYNQQQMGPQGPAINPTLGPQQGAPGQYQSQLPAVYPISISPDISLDGRILGNPSRKFLLEGGAGEETVKDNCFSGTGRDAEGKVMPEHEYHVERFLQPSTDKLQFTFDSRGNLIINMQTATGMLSSNVYVPYQLDADSQTIHMGDADGDQPLVLSGKISQPYAEHEENDARTGKRIDDIKLKKMLSISSDFPDDFPGPNGSGGSGNGTGFVLGPQASSNLNGSQGSTQNSSDCISSSPQSGHTVIANGADGKKSGGGGISVKAGSSESLADQLREPLKQSYCQPANSSLPSMRKVPNRMFMTFPAGITAKILTHPSQPQHITSMWIDKVSFTNNSFVQSPSGEDCDPGSTGSLHHIQLK